MQSFTSVPPPSLPHLLRCPTESEAPDISGHNIDVLGRNSNEVWIAIHQRLVHLLQSSSKYSS